MYVSEETMMVEYCHRYRIRILYWSQKLYGCIRQTGKYFVVELYKKILGDLQLWWWRRFLCCFCCCHCVCVYVRACVCVFFFGGLNV